MLIIKYAKNSIIGTAFDLGIGRTGGELRFTPAPMRPLVLGHYAARDASPTQSPISTISGNFLQVRPTV
jgi:hypothetical protein